MTTSYPDKNRPYPSDDASKRFMTWLKATVKENPRLFPAAQRSSKGMLKRDVVIGDSVIVDSAPTPTGYDRVRLVATEFPWSEFNQLIKPSDAQWEKAQALNKDLMGVKAVPLRITPPVTDDPTLYVEYAEVPYAIIPSFQNWLQGSPHIQEQLVEQAFRFRNPDGRKMPGSLAVDVAVVIGSEANKGPSSRDRYLLLAHRVARRGGFYPDCWSASFEEQFAPVRSEWGGRLHSADNNLIDTVIRGLREEFLSDRFSKKISASIQAVFVDLVNLNLQLLAVVRLSDTSFSEVVAHWSSGEAPDSSEHDLLAAMKLEPEILKKAVSAEGPEGLIEIYSDPGLAHKAVHPWHPRSQARIACCLWMLEEGLL